MKFLRNAVIEHNGAREPFSEVATVGHSYHQIYSELKGTVQLEFKFTATKAFSRQLSAPSAHENFQIHFRNKEETWEDLRTFRKDIALHTRNEPVSVLSPSRILLSIAQILLNIARKPL